MKTAVVYFTWVQLSAFDGFLLSGFLTGGFLAKKSAWKFDLDLP
jgi:hypothetical protein